MPIYDFGSQILKAIQIQDELKLKNKQIQLDQQKFNANFGLRERQLELEDKKVQSAIDYNNAQIQNIADDNALSIAKDIRNNYMSLNDIPPEIQKKLQPNDILVGSQYDSVFGTPDGKYINRNTYTNLRNLEIDRINRIKANASKTSANASLINANASKVRAVIDKNAEKIKLQNDKDYKKFSSSATGNLEGLKNLVANKDVYDDAVSATAYEKYRKDIKTDVDMSLKALGVSLDRPTPYRGPDGIVKTKPFWDLIRDAGKPNDAIEKPEEMRVRLYRNVNKLYDSGGITLEMRDVLKTYIEAVTTK